ncbi:N2227-like protein-domain-containing protein [Pterulicium gracile]|uniref:N2227-like protein-domain-containing protein n=1 Tax=Pterulicium gracile TaxID=1884261 RepID=A0A5C3QPG7_9AGAR|nr:N2227-like protein-domain-containing protein [Pterula gracilis]
MAELALRKGERKGRKPRVFVPGCGLGRLAWEVSELGYDTTALDFSSYASLALRFLLSSSTHTRNQHAMQPFAYYLPHQRSNANLFRTVRIPDVVPREEPGSFTFLQGDFLKHRPPPPSPSPNSKEKGKEGKGGYDYIVTLFFLDTAADVFTYLSHIHSLLAPGGLWINLGPLLWTSGYTACPALSLEEVLEAVKRSGFALLGEGDAGGNGVGGGKRGGGGNGKSGKELLGGLPLDLVKRRPIQCGYTADKHAMMSYEYHAEFWVARKVVDSL